MNNCWDNPNYWQMNKIVLIVWMIGSMYHMTCDYTNANMNIIWTILMCLEEWPDIEPERGRQWNSIIYFWRKGLDIEPEEEGRWWNIIIYIWRKGPHIEPAEKMVKIKSYWIWTEWMCMCVIHVSVHFTYVVCVTCVWYYRH